MRKSLLILASAAALLPGYASAENKAVSQSTDYYQCAPKIVDVPFSATGRDFEVDEYNVTGMPHDACYSVGVWFYPISTSYTGSEGYGAIFAYSPTGEGHHFNKGQTHWGLYTDSAGNYTLHIQSNGGGVSDVAESKLGTYDFNKWHYALVSIDNKNLHIRIWIDGESVLDSDMSCPLYAADNKGQFHFAQYGVNKINFDEIQFFGKALTDSDASTAFKNAANVTGVTAIYTLDKVLEGTTGTFANDMLGGVSVPAVMTQHKFGAYWGDGALVNWASKSEVAPTLVDGRDMSTAEKVLLAVSSASNGTLTLDAGETSLGAGTHDAAPGTEYTVTATPAAGYQLVSIIATTPAGAAVVSNGSTIKVLGNTVITPKFSNELKSVKFVNELEIPFTVYHNGGVVYESTSTEDFKGIAGETYYIELDVPYDKELKSVSVGTTDLDLVDGKYAFTLSSDIVVTINAAFKNMYTVSIVNPELNGQVAGTVTLTNAEGAVFESGDKAIEGEILTLGFTVNEGFRYLHHMVNGEPTAAKTFTVSSATTVSAAVEAGKEYPVMTRRFARGINQQNRYIKSLKTNGTETPVVFEAAAQEDLGIEFYAGPAGTYLPEGAIVNKTGIRANPIVVDQATTAFTYTIVPWTDPVSFNGNSYNTELNWTQMNYFIDWNNDGDFLDENEQSEQDAIEPADGKYDNVENCTRTVNVPEGTAAGKYRMRIIFHEAYDEDWRTSIWEENKINCGVAYDFDIVVKSADLESPRTVSANVNDEKAGSVEIVDVPDIEAGATTVTTTYKYVKIVSMANEGAKLLSWTDKDGVEVGTEASYTYTGETDNEFTANFGYQINHDITGEGTLAVAMGDKNYGNGAYILSGSEVKVIPTPNNDLYLVESLAVNGEDVTLAADGTYTFTVTGPTTISAVFVEKKFHLVLTHEGNGTVTVGTEADADGDAVPSIFEGDEITEDVAFYVACKPLGDDSVKSIKYTIGDETVEVPVTDLPAYSDEVNAWVIEPKGVGFYIEGLKSDVLIHTVFTGIDAINGVELDAENGAVEYYNLQGVKVAAENLTNGFYIVRQGNKAAKVLINK